MIINEIDFLKVFDNNFLLVIIQIQVAFLGLVLVYLSLAQVIISNLSSLTKSKAFYNIYISLKIIRLCRYVLLNTSLGIFVGILSVYYRNLYTISITIIILILSLIGLLIMTLTILNKILSLSKIAEDEK